MTDCVRLALPAFRVMKRGFEADDLVKVMAQAKPVAHTLYSRVTMRPVCVCGV